MNGHKFAWFSQIYLWQCVCMSTLMHKWIYEWVLPTRFYMLPTEGTIPFPKSKRSRSSQPKIKPVAIFYNKMCVLVSSLGDLIDIQTLTDTTVLQASGLLLFYLALNCLSTVSIYTTACVKCKLCISLI